MNKNLPTEHILSLFSSPIDVKENEVLFTYLKDYIENFAEAKSLGLVELKESSLSIIGEQSLSRYKDILEANKPKNVNFKSVIDLKDSDCFACPVFIHKSGCTWLILNIPIEGRERCLNKFFFKYLENVSLCRGQQETLETMTVLATTDDVTGLFNQRKLSEDLENAVKMHEAQHEKFSIMFIDVDHFKNVNDDYGHIIGSKLLLDLGKALQLILRQTDHIYRYGGDEFVVIMPNVETSIVHQVAVRDLDQLKNHAFDIDNDDQTYQMSVSIGIAEYPTDAKSAMEIIRFADEMMYQSKKSGRGKVFHVKEVASADVDSE